MTESPRRWKYRFVFDRTRGLRAGRFSSREVEADIVKPVQQWLAQYGGAFGIKQQQYGRLVYIGLNDEDLAFHFKMAWASTPYYVECVTRRQDCAGPSPRG